MALSRLKMPHNAIWTQYELKEANKQIESLQWELKESMAIREDYRKSLSSESERWKNLVDHVGAYREDSMINRRNQLCAEEKLRRQTEMLEECQGKLDISLQMNNALVVKQAELQNGRIIWTTMKQDTP
ncbi:hypothetical protein N7520_002198 [Penicillium odoratum]|uniref:uncharacterized protein n=1 Tax=Penicillium odoratum TaxID=1167516 RepID=UPI0025467C36|nr:uncharacterized protein N7520_002198 [Penicillium odoratum]KAJ5771669.1 hypothetical protein N7520_002198 [Penicillium odoratum]